MDHIVSFLNLVVFSFRDQAVTLGQILFIPALFVVGFLVIKLVLKLLTRHLVAHDFAPEIITLIRRVIFVVGFAVLFITALDFINVPLTAFAFVSGAVAIGIGFGAQNIINNFISGWILMWERPIRIGDFLEIEAYTGTVEAIGTRSTRVKRVDGVHMLIPNSALLEKTVINWTLIDGVTRTKIRVGVAYGSSIKRVSELIMQALEEHEAVLEDPAPLVIFDDFGTHALIFDAYPWVDILPDRDLRVVRSDIRFRIGELFDKNDIEVALPQQDVHVDGAIKLLNKH